VNIPWQTYLLVVIVAVLFMIEYRVTQIHLKLTERQRLKEKKEKDSLKAWFRDIDAKKRAWDSLSEEDQARFNDFYYEHAVGKISDEVFEQMKKDLHDKSNGVLE
jgi:hypothetical protein